MHKVMSGVKPGKMKYDLKLEMQRFMERCPGPKSSASYWRKFLKENEWCKFSARTLSLKYQSVLINRTPREYFNVKEKKIILQYIADYKGSHFPGQGSKVWRHLLCLKGGEFNNRTVSSLRMFYKNHIKKEKDEVESKFRHVVDTDMLNKIYSKIANQVERLPNFQSDQPDSSDEIDDEFQHTEPDDESFDNTLDQFANSNDLLASDHRHFRSKAPDPKIDVVEDNTAEEIADEDPMTDIKLYAELIFTSRRSSNDNIKFISDSAIATLFCLENYNKLLSETSFSDEEFSVES